MKKYFLFMFLCASIQLAMAQTKTITVVVTAAEGTVEGATVRNLRSQRGGITDDDGRLSISAQNGDQLLTSYFGYEDDTLTVDSRSNYEIDLIEAAYEVTDVFITALGLARESRALGYAVQQIGEEAINEARAVNFLDNLAGKVAGLSITAGPTGVGSTSKVAIRGESSFTQNNPLFVVDGIVVNNNSVVNFTNDAAAGFQEVDFGNGAMSINPADVASVSVLKGPSAAALYGTRASNGVIIITTKDGSEAKGLGISFNSTLYFEKPFQLPQFQNRYGQGNSGQFEYVDGLGGGVNDNISYSYGPELDAGLLIPQFDSPVTLPDGSQVRGGDVAVHGGLPITPTPFVSNPDNLQNFYETGITTINNLALSGRYDRGHYRLSVTDLRSQSVIPGVNLDRKTAAARLTFKPVERLEVSASLNYVNSASDNRPANGYGSENIGYSLVAWGPRQLQFDPLRDYWQPGLEGTQQYSFNYTFFDNPYLILLENRNSFNRDRFFGNLVASYQIAANLSFKLRSGMDYSDETRQFRRAFSSNRFRNGAYAEHEVSFREINTDFLLNYGNTFGPLGVDVSIGGNRMDQQAATSQAQTVALAQPGIFRLSNAAAPIEVFEFGTRKRINSLYGLAKLSFQDFLFVDITGRNDWSSALATPNSTDNVSFFYPSVSASWVISNLFSLPGVISFAKLRASWAQVGNDTDPYQTAGVFQAQTPFNSQPTFSDQDLIANANLLPEQTTSFEFGADLRFFQDRLSLDATYYQSRTENQIISLPIALSSGYNEQVVNGGSVLARGWEVVLGVKPIYTKKLRWTALFNFNRNVATVESIPEGIDRLTLAYTRVYDNVNQTVWYQVREGDRIGDMWGTGYLRNEEGQFVVDEQGRFIVDNDLRKLGNYNPDFVLGFSNRVEWRRFTLNFVLDWRQGGVIVSRTQALAGVAGQLIETADRPAEGITIDGVVNTGTADEPNYVPNTTPISAESYYRSYYDRNHEENNTLDASYLKLREVNLGYSFSLPGIQSFQVALVGRNLLAFSGIKHFDPEQFAVQGQNFVSGVEDISYPSVRSLGLRIGLEF